MNYYKFSNVTQGVKLQKTTQIVGNICLTIEQDNIIVRIINGRTLDLNKIIIEVKYQLNHLFY